MDPGETQEESPAPQTQKEKQEDKWNNVKAGVFLSSITGCSILAGFGMTLGGIKKSDPDNFAKGVVGARELHETGLAVASRTLARATLYTVSGFGLVCFAVWKMMGVNTFEEFRWKVGNALPRLKRQESTGRNEFSSIRDLFEYIIEEDEKEKKLKAEAKHTACDSTST